MKNPRMFKNLSLSLGLLCGAGVLCDAAVFAAPRQSTAGATTNLLMKIPQRDANYGGVTGDGDTGGDGVLRVVPTLDSVPYHLNGEVIYDMAGNMPAPRSLRIVLKEIHIAGWFDSNGHLPYPCGTFSINAKHVWINGTDYSSQLQVDSGLVQQGQVVSKWFVRLSTPYPTFQVYPTWPGTAHGPTITIRADVSYSGDCIPTGNRSLTASVVI